MEKVKVSPKPTIPLPIKIFKKTAKGLPQNTVTYPTNVTNDASPKSFSTYYQTNKHLPDKMKTCNVCNSSVEATIYTTHVESHPSKILDWLYVGTYNNATNKKELELLNIKYIMNCAKECNNLFPHDINYIHFKLTDKIDSEIADHFDAAFKFLDDAKNKQCNVLVHCQLGKSRSVSLVIAYLIKTQKLTYEEAYKFVKGKRKVAFPNLGFVRQLRDLEKALNLDFKLLYKSYKSSNSYNSNGKTK